LRAGLACVPETFLVEKVEIMDVKRELDDKMTGLFEKANGDPDLKRQLLHDPASVAEKYGVKFKENEIESLKNIGALMDLADEIKIGRLYPRPPIFYPMHVWQIQEMMEIFTHIMPGSIGPGPIFYPAEPNWAFYRPSWIAYSFEGQGGGGSVSSWGRPGPIFYPASLINFMKERMAQILQVLQG
jgi:hypothetical protein